MKTLYKKDSKGKIRVLNYWTKDDKFCQSSGILGGQLVENEKSCKGKNIGKSNETNGKQQAILEMESKIREKLQEDYFLTKEEAEFSEVILPMLAKKYQDHCKKVNWSKAFIQPKLDGMRMLAIIKNGKVTLLSRDGIDMQKEHGSLQHIINELSTIEYDIILDGEAYCHGLSFQDNMKLIKKYRKGESEQIHYHVYDRISTEQFSERNVRSFIKDFQYCEEVPTYSIFNEDDIKTFHDKFLEAGYEGSIIRHGEKPYKMNGRCDSLLKYKDFDDNEYEIVDIIPAENRPEWGIVVCKIGEQLFNATPKMSHDDKIDLLINKRNYIGKLAVVTHFGYTNKRIPRFPIYKGLRLDNNKKKK